MKVEIVRAFDFEADRKTLTRVLLIAAGKAFFIGGVNLDDINRRVSPRSI